MPPRKPDTRPWRIDPVRFAKARKDKGVSQITIRDDTGVSLRGVSRMETGTHDGSPSMEDVGAVADYLGVDIYWLCNRARPK